MNSQATTFLLLLIIIKLQLDEFIMQLMHNPLIFTAHGFFNLNHQFIQSVGKFNILF